MRKVFPWHSQFKHQWTRNIPCDIVYASSKLLQSMNSSILMKMEKWVAFAHHQHGVSFQMKHNHLYSAISKEHYHINIRHRTDITSKNIVSITHELLYRSSLSFCCSPCRFQVQFLQLQLLVEEDFLQVFCRYKVSFWRKHNQLYNAISEEQ